MSNWHDVNRLRIIHEFKRRPWMWQASHADFNNQDKRRVTLTHITNSINQHEQQAFTELEVRNQFKNMKDMYRRKIKKLKQMKEMSLPVEPPQWAYFQHLRFLDNSEDGLNSASYQNESADDVDEEEDEEQDESSENKGPVSIMDDLLKATLQQDNGSLQTRRRSKRRAEIASSASESTAAGRPETKMARVQPTANARVQSTPSSNLLLADESDPVVVGAATSFSSASTNGVKLTQNGGALDGVSSPSRKVAANSYANAIKQRHAVPTTTRMVEEIEDDFTCFGRFIGSSLRKLAMNSPICALRTKKLINDMMFEAEFQELSNGFADDYEEAGAGDEMNNNNINNFLH